MFHSLFPSALLCYCKDRPLLWKCTVTAFSLNRTQDTQMQGIGSCRRHGFPVTTSCEADTECNSTALVQGSWHKTEQDAELKMSGQPTLSYSRQSQKHVR